MGASTRTMWAVMPQEPTDLATRTSDTNHHYLFTAAQRSHNLERERAQLGQMSKHLAFTTFPPLREQELIGLRPEKRGSLGPAPHQLWSRPLGPSPLPTHTTWTCPTSRLAGPWGSSCSLCIALGFFTPRSLAERSPPHGRCSLIPATGFRSSPCACEAPHDSITSNPTPARCAAKCHLSLFREGRAHSCLVKLCHPVLALGQAGRGPPGLPAIGCLLQQRGPCRGSH